MQILSDTYLEPAFVQRCQQELRDRPDMLEYLHNRAITDEAIAKFKIGYFHGQGYSSYDRRLLFPVTDLSGGIVTFQGRAMYDWKEAGEPKYYHGSYQKQSALYGLYESYTRILKHNCVVITEGPTDAIAFWIAGFGSVALLSANMSQEQALILRMFCDRAVIALDNDPTGVKARDKVATTLLSVGIIPYVVRLQQDKDPSDALVRRGIQYLRNEVIRSLA